MSGAIGTDVTGTSVASIASSSITISTGNLVYVGVKTGGSSCNTDTVTVTDTSSTNTFTVISANILAPTKIGCMFEFYAKNAVAKTNDVVTANFSPSLPYVSVAVLQFSGADTSSPLDQTAVNNSSGNVTTETSASFTPGVTGEVACATGAWGTTTNTFTAGSGYTIPAAANDSKQVAAEYKLSIGTSSQTAAMTASTTAVAGIVVATFKVAVAGGACGGSNAMALLGVGCR